MIVPPAPSADPIPEVSDPLLRGQKYRDMHKVCSGHVKRHFKAYLSLVLDQKQISS